MFIRLIVLTIVISIVVPRMWFERWSKKALQRWRVYKAGKLARAPTRTCHLQQFRVRVKVMIIDILGLGFSTMRIEIRPI